MVKNSYHERKLKKGYERPILDYDNENISPQNKWIANEHFKVLKLANKSQVTIMSYLIDRRKIVNYNKHIGSIERKSRYFDHQVTNWLRLLTTFA